MKLGKITLFDSADDFDIIKIDIQSPELHRLNNIISKNFEVTETYPQYHPHCTLAYAKKGYGVPYNGNAAFEGRKIVLDSVLFFGKDNRKTEFKIKKAYFNQTTKEYPNYQKRQYREKTALFVCVSCNLRRYMPTVSPRCPRCGHSMKKS